MQTTPNTTTGRVAKRSDRSICSSCATSYTVAGSVVGTESRTLLTGLEIVLSEPYPQILYWFAMAFTTPIPAMFSWTRFDIDARDSWAARLRLNSR